MNHSEPPSVDDDNPLPLFLKLRGRRVLVVGGGAMAASKLKILLSTGASVTLVSPRIVPEAVVRGVRIRKRCFRESDLEGAWLVITAATPEVNARVAQAATRRRIFVNAVDDRAHASAYFGGTIRRGRLTLAISSGGHAPSLVRLLREALERLLPENLKQWLDLAESEREGWLRNKLNMRDRTPLLAAAIGRLYEKSSSNCDTETNSNQ